MIRHVSFGGPLGYLHESLQVARASRDLPCGDEVGQLGWGCDARFHGGRGERCCVVHVTDWWPDI